MNEQEFAELAAAAALDALSPEDAQRYHAALAEHPEWGRDGKADAIAAARLADAVIPVAPPAEIRAALLAKIASTPQDGTSPQDAAPATSAPESDTSSADAASSAGRAGLPKAPAHRLRILFALAACLVLLVGVGVGVVAINQQLNRPASVVALEDIRSADDAQQATIELADGGTATAHWSASVGAAVLVTDGLAELPDDRSYELWFVRGETPISAGVFEVDGGDATALLSGDMHEGDVIAVTVEQAGGSPDGQPTTDPVIAIPTA